MICAQIDPVSFILDVRLHLHSESRVSNKIETDLQKRP